MGASRKLRDLTLGALFTALSAALLYLGGTLPSGRLGLTAAAGLAPGAALAVSGAGGGWTVYAAASLLSLILSPDKNCALLFVLFFGLYVMVKHYIERLRRIVTEWVLKLFFFYGMFSVIWFLGSEILSLPEKLAEIGAPALFAAGGVVFVLYDIGLSRLAAALPQLTGFLGRGKG